MEELRARRVAAEQNIIMSMLWKVPQVKNIGAWKSRGQASICQEKTIEVASQIGRCIALDQMQMAAMQPVAELQ